MRIGIGWLLLLMPLAPWAQTPEEDERRIEEIIRARYGPTQEEIEALARQGLGPDGQPLIDPVTGLPMQPGPDLVLTPTSEPVPVSPASDAASETQPSPDLPPVGPIQFEDLSKLVGHWVKLKTYNGRTWQGQVKAVKDNEVQVIVTQRGGAALMTLKKHAIVSLERI